MLTQMCMNTLSYSFILSVLHFGVHRGARNCDGERPAYMYTCMHICLHTYVYPHRYFPHCTSVCIIGHALAMMSDQFDANPAWKTYSTVANHSHRNTLQHTATHCTTLQHTATHCNTLQHTAIHCNTLQHTATHGNSLQHTATHCNALQHTATRCNTLQHTAQGWNTCVSGGQFFLQHVVQSGEDA